tara:strand:+ start:11194 stop:11403 length:210 start_codon:yes stop_codon:yes gene_type:complete
MIKFLEKIFGKEDNRIVPPQIKNEDYEKPFDDVRISVLRSDYEELKKQLLKNKTTIRNLKKKIASLKKR